jgi:VanZ family protein
MPDDRPGRRDATIRIATGIGVLGWSALIWLVSAMPLPPRVPGGFSDKTLHFAAYFLHGAFARGAVGSFGGAGLVATSASAGWGALDEYHQSFVPGRDASPADWIADLAGAAAGAATVSLFAGRSQPK